MKSANKKFNPSNLPKMEKTTTPAMMLVAKSKKLIANV